MANRQIPKYYVYEHWRLDRDECFYVGKGCGKRAYETHRRGNHWDNIVAKLERTGFGYEIRLVKTGLTEKEAFNLERERIAFWRDKVDLANKTDGGEGASGMKHTAETKAKMSRSRKGNQYAKGNKHSDEFKEWQRQRMSNGNAPSQRPGVGEKISKTLRSLGDNHPTKRPETRAKNSASRKGKCVGKDNGFYGKRHPDDVIERIRQKNIGRFAGSKHHNSKLNEENVIEILKSDEPRKILAERFGVSYVLISKIKQRKAWSHVEADLIKGNQ